MASQPSPSPLLVDEQSADEIARIVRGGGEKHGLVVPHHVGNVGERLVDVVAREWRITRASDGIKLTDKITAGTLSNCGIDFSEFNDKFNNRNNAKKKL